jgi:DNA modification methylase
MFINQSMIIIPDNRMRRDFDKREIEKLAASIEHKGLMHPVVLQDDYRTLVAGERRLRAIALLHEAKRRFQCHGNEVKHNEVPFTPLGALSSIDLREAELEENIIRVDLHWSVVAKAQAELHHLRVEQHGLTPRNQFNPVAGWSLADTASEILGRQAKNHEVKEISTALQLEEFLDDPIVAAARNPREALKAIKEEKKRIHRTARAKIFDESTSEHKLHLQSCYEFLRATPERYDVIITDPPYGIDIDKITFWDGDSHDYDDSDAAFLRVANEFSRLAFDAAAAQAHAYIFCDIRRFSDLFIGFELAGWDCWPLPLIWAKGNTGSFPNADYGPRRTYEAILYANKGRKVVTAMYTDVIAITNPGQQNHPAGKPVDLYINLLRRSVVPGDRVFDGFAGGGPIFPACAELKCIATACEINDKYFAMALESLEKTL